MRGHRFGGIVKPTPNTSDTFSFATLKIIFEVVLVHGVNEELGGKATSAVFSVWTRFSLNEEKYTILAKTISYLELKIAKDGHHMFE